MFDAIMFLGDVQGHQAGEPMTSIIHLSPKDPIPTERHVAVVVHRGRGGVEQGYFFDSDDGDSGGSGPFDWRMDEAIERAERFARDHSIEKVVVRTARL